MVVLSTKSQGDDSDSKYFTTAAPSELKCSEFFLVRENDLDYVSIRRLISQWREINFWYAGDYYPLLKSSQANGAWIAWQYDCLEKGQGVGQAFRRPKCTQYEAVRLKHRGLNLLVKYQFTRFDHPEQTEATSEELMRKGICILIPKSTGTAVIKYWQIPRV
jgi:hypothetical protein